MTDACLRTRRTLPFGGSRSDVLPVRKTALAGGLLRGLLLRFLERNALPERWVELYEFDLPLDLLAVLAGEVDVVGLRRLQLYEVVLRHAKTIADRPYNGNFPLERGYLSSGE